MRVIFDKNDGDKSGRLNAHEFTKALQLMGDYKYSVAFVVEMLKLVFDEEWDNKKNNFLFKDFTDFMSEFEPVHYEVIRRIEAKLREKSINDIDVGDARIVNLLQYAQMKNDGLFLGDVFKHLDRLKQEDEPQAIVSPLTSISESKNVSNAEDNVASIANQDFSKEDENKLFEAMDNAPNRANNCINVLELDTDALVKCLNEDKTFKTTMIRRECCQIIRAQLWNGKDLIQALKLNKIDEILLLFKNMQNYEYIMQSIKRLNVKSLT